MTQLGFDDLLSQTETDNEVHALKRQYPDLPTSWDTALPHYQNLLQRCDAAFLAADGDEINRIYGEAEALATIIQGKTSGLLALDGAGTILAEKTRAPVGATPLWGQEGEFIIEAAGVTVRMETDGIFGISTRYVLLPGFAAHAVDFDKPFISETGFRSFIGYGARVEPGVTIEAFAKALIEHHVAHALKGRLVAIEDKYRLRAAAAPGLEAEGA
jgi:hypothetical protein